MKIMLIMVNKRYDADALSLKECGFKVGDVLEVSHVFDGGETYAQVPEDTDQLFKGEFVSIEPGEFVVVES